ncbi:MAG: taurine--2-oxoglutarate transaminase [Myxococcota bacterium]|jgi:taurine--2-oxoglutarate transaminase
MSDIEARQRKHLMFTWSAQRSATPVPIAGGEGAEFFDHDGNRWLDFESQVFNCNVGHGDKRIINAMKAQLDELACAHPAAVFEAKAALGEALASITPEGMNRFMLCLSGSEANENALKIARMVTGRTKVIARRRSYHGATMGALSLTGDPRRHHAEPGLWGVLRTEDPYCYRCPFGQSYPGCGVRCAEHLEAVIEMEGPDSIAAVFMEGVTGANGGFVPPPEYWPRIREICTKYGILLVSDEVFTGFGRTGKWFAVDHFGVTPDLITMAKGLTGGYAPLGAVAMTDEIAAHFDDNTFWCGLTGYGAPVSVAAAAAAIEVYKEDRLMEQATERGLQLTAALDDLKAKHDCIGDVRSIGLFGTIEFVTDRTLRTPLVPYNTNPKPGSPGARLKQGLLDRRVHAATRYSWLFIAPPLCISPEQLSDGIARIDETITAAFGQG